MHQGSPLSPLLFVVVREEATKECRIGDPWELLQVSLDFYANLIYTNLLLRDLKNIIIN